MISGTEWASWRRQTENIIRASLRTARDLATACVSTLTEHFTRASGQETYLLATERSS